MRKSLRLSAATLGSRGGHAGVGESKRRGDSDFYRQLVALRKDRKVDGTGMKHRHLNHQELTPAAIDDIIGNGGWSSWSGCAWHCVVTRASVTRSSGSATPGWTTLQLSGITSGGSMPRTPPQLDDWEKVLFAAAYLQKILPDAVLVGGSASALHARHRISLDADHVPADLTQRFDEVLAQLESVAGWQTARVQRPVQIFGSLDGILTGVRQLIRKKPLETQTIRWRGRAITLPTLAEMLRIKAVLILKRTPRGTTSILLHCATSWAIPPARTLCALLIGSIRSPIRNRPCNSPSFSLRILCRTTSRKGG